MKSGGLPANARYLSKPLLASVLISPELERISQMGIEEKLYLTGARYDSKANINEWNKSLEMLENWLVLFECVKEIQDIPTVSERIQSLTTKIEQAQKNFEIIQTKFPSLSSQSKNFYLKEWKEAMDVFAEYIKEK